MVSFIHLSCSLLFLHTWHTCPLHTWHTCPLHTWQTCPLHTWHTCPLHRWHTCPLHTWHTCPSHPLSIACLEGIRLCLSGSSPVSLLPALPLTLSIFVPLRWFAYYTTRFLRYTLGWGGSVHLSRQGKAQRRFYRRGFTRIWRSHRSATITGGRNGCRRQPGNRPTARWQVTYFGGFWPYFKKNLFCWTRLRGLMSPPSEGCCR
jgi:hypothetical protein